MPTVSLILLNHNRAAYLAETIASVLAQTYTDFELVVWDDGSTDESLAVAQSFAAQDPRVRVVAAAHQDGWIAKARKAAIAQTHGTYLGWVDSDDRLTPTALEHTVAVLDHQADIGMVYTDYQTIDAAGQVTGYGQRCQIPYSRDRLLVDFHTFHFRLLRRQVYEQIGGIDERFRYAYDYDLCLRLSEATQIHHLPLPLYHYRYHANANSLTRQQERAQWSKTAIQAALGRRGLGDRLWVDLRWHHHQPRFYLRKKRSLPVGHHPSLPWAASIVALPLTLALSNAALAQSIVPAQDGTGTVVNQTGNQYDITGGTRSGDGGNLFHSLEQLGLSQEEIANFQSNPAIQNILTRVVGGDASVLDGLIRVTGGDANLFLLNPAGIVFGSNARLDLNGSFTATTATGIGFENGWFNVEGTPEYQSLVGDPRNFAFATLSPGALVNSGTLAVEAGESLTLLGGTVVNTGTLSAPGGQITVTAVEGNQRVRLSQPGSPLSLEIRPLTAGDGVAGLSFRPLDLPTLLTGGTVAGVTDIAVLPDGTVQLVSSGTTIPTAAGTAIASGQLATTTTTLGRTPEINVLGNQVALVDATLTADAPTGGGTIRVGGAYQGRPNLPTAESTVVLPGSRLSANATQQGNGGNVILWADDLTAFWGTISARGINGDGGFVEVSGAEDLIYRGQVDVSAINGQTGTLLLDPTNITIAREASTPPAVSTALPEILAGELAGQDITVSADELEAQLADIVLEATNDITIEPGVALNFEFTSVGDITFRADADNDGFGSFLMDAADRIFTQGRNLTIQAANIEAGNLDVQGDFGGGSGDLRLEITSGAQFFSPQIETGDLLAFGGGYGSDAGGTITLLNPTGTIETQEIDVSSTSGNAGTVNIDADLVRVNGSIDASEGGTVTITHRGGPNNVPFTIGTPNPVNGVSDLISVGSSSIITFGSFPVLATGGAATFPTAISNITLQSVNQAPDLSFSPSTLTTQKDQPIIIPITVSISDPDLDLVDLRILASSIPAGATVRVNGVAVSGSDVVFSIEDEDTLEFTPPPGFVGTINAFRLVGSDRTNGIPFLTNSAPITIQVQVLNGDPGSPTHDGPNVPETPIFDDPPIDDSPLRDDPPQIDPPGSLDDPATFPLTIDCCVRSTEAAYTQEFVAYLGLEQPEIATVDDGRTIAQAIEDATGVRPAFVYVNFVPPNVVVRSERPMPQATDELELIVVSAQGGTLRRRIAGVTRADVMAVTQLYRDAITNPRNVRNTRYQQPAQQLYNWMIAPILGDLRTLEIENLVFLPEVGLRSLPFAALYDGEQFLIEEFSVGLMPSLSLTDTRYVDVRNAEILAMGVAESTQGQTPLPAVPLEVDTLASKLWPGQTFLNTNSTIANLRLARQQQPYGIIHLATHADFVAGEIGQSYIQLWNERLRLDEIRQLGWNDPPVELLVLSACRTALGDERAELGFAGLAVQSGVKSAVASLWYVSDAGTAGLMTRFYESLREAPIKAEALRQAQLAMARGEVFVDETGQLQGLGEIGGLQLPAESATEVLGQPLSHPYYWAAFTMIGNPW